MATQLQEDTIPWVEERRPFDVHSFGMTDLGKVRKRNEDQFLVADLTKTLNIRQTSMRPPKTRFGEQQAHLFLVADGMGGHPAGDQASALTVEAMEAFVLNTFQWFSQFDGTEGRDVMNAIKEALRRTDEHLGDLAVEHPEMQGMGTTLTLAFLLDEKLLVAHVGDSRCYRLREGKLYQLTHDHTVVAELVRRGVIAPEQARQHPYRNVITNVVGGPHVGVEVETQQHDVKAGDLVMLCSDGLTEMVPIQTICDLLQSVIDPKQACEQLVALANKNGGKDNITVVVFRCDTSTGPPNRQNKPNESRSEMSRTIHAKEDCDVQAKS